MPGSTVRHRQNAQFLGKVEILGSLAKFERWLQAKSPDALLALQETTKKSWSCAAGADCLVQTGFKTTKTARYDTLITIGKKILPENGQHRSAHTTG